MIRRLANREVERKFRGTVFGLVWALIGPLFMLAIYSFAFGTVFGARWALPGANSTEVPYSLAIFSGLLLAGMFMELLNRAPGLVLENVSYVKKVVFPLEIIPVVALYAALVTTCIAFLVFVTFYVYLLGLPPLTILLIPFHIIPLLCLTLGLCYMLASLGVFLRDIGQIVPPIATALLLTSTTFFQLEQLPVDWKNWVLLNPLTIPITGFRDLAFAGKLPEASLWLMHFAVSLLVLGIGAYWFQKTKKAFADVL
ncbi:MAG: ABC transporter permease [Rhizobiaceae bacterium]